MNLPEFKSGLFALVAVLPISGSAQGVSALQKALQAAMWSGSFYRIPAALPTKAGVLVTDAGSESVVLIAKGKVVPGGLRDGDGPREVRSVNKLFPFRSDSALALGKDRLRLAVLDPKGRPTRSISLREVDARDSLRLFELLGADQNGRMLFFSPRIAKGQGDSADLVIVGPQAKEAYHVGAIWSPLPDGLGEPGASKAAADLPDPDQVRLLPDGAIVDYRSRNNVLAVLPGLDGGAAEFRLPARARPVSDRERQLLVAAREQMRKRYDSTLTLVPPKARPRMSAIFKGALSRMVPTEVPAYLPYSMVVLSRDIVALARGDVVGEGVSVFDWVDVSNGRHGTFDLPAVYRLLGAGIGRVVFGRVGPDGFVEVCSLPLDFVLSGSGGWQ